MSVESDGTDVGGGGTGSSFCDGGGGSGLTTAVGTNGCATDRDKSERAKSKPESKSMLVDFFNDCIVAGIACWAMVELVAVLVLGTTVVGTDAIVVGANDGAGYCSGGGWLAT